jgi:hypothetical protein
MIKNHFRIGFVTFTLLFGIASTDSAHAQGYSFLEMASLTPTTRYLHFETENFEFDYEDGYLEFAKESAKHLEHAHTILSPLLKWNPRSKIHVLIADNEDSANGFAMPSLRVGMVLIATPPDQWYSTSYTDHWIKLLAFHEYVHILNIDPTHDLMELLRIVYGDAIRPNGLSPRWMLEGLAVYFETRTSKLGRGRSPYYEGIVRSYFNEGLLGNETKDRFHYGTLSGSWPYFPSGEVPYLFGYHLWNQFVKQTADESKTGEYSINSSGRVPFFNDTNLHKTLNKDWGDLWNDFIAESKPRYLEQIAKVKEAGETPYEKITDSRYSAHGGVLSPNGDWLAYTETTLEERSGLILKNMKTGKTQKIRDKVQGASMSFTPDGRFLIFSSLEQSHTFQQFSDLFSYDLESRRFHRLSERLRAKDPDVSPSGTQITFTVVDHGTILLKSASLILENGIPQLNNIQTLYQPSAFSIIATPRWINDHEVVFSEQKLNEAEARILKVNVSATHAPTVLVSNGKINRFPIRCGTKVLHVSDQSGIDNVYEGDRPVTNVITGTQFPFCSADGQLYGSLLTANGFELVRFNTTDSLVKDHSLPIAKPDAPEILTESLQSPEIRFDESSISEYSPFRTLLPRQWAPVGYVGYNQNTYFSLGGTLLGFDISGRHQYLGSFSYYSKSETWDGNISYTYYGFRPSITLSGASYTTDTGTIGETTIYKRTHELSLQFDHLTKWTWSSLRISPYLLADWNGIYEVGSSDQLESSDPEYTKPIIPVAGTTLNFSDVYLSKLGFMPEGGSNVVAATEARVYPDDFTLWKFMTGYTRYFSPGNHHVLAPKFRYYASSHPYGYERSYAMLRGKNTENIFDRGRGFNLNQMQIRGYPDLSFKTKSSAQLALDYHFPLIQTFSGTGPLFIQQFHGFIFGEATYIPSTRIPNLYLPSVGLGATCDTTLLWNLPLSISAEFQYGTKKEYGGDQLFFISLETSAL